MSSSNQPGEPRVKNVDETGDNETLNRDIDDTAGHAMKPRGVDEVDDDSTEGHPHRK